MSNKDRAEASVNGLHEAPMDPTLTTIDELIRLAQAYKQHAGKEGSREDLLGVVSKLESQLMLPSEVMVHQQWAQTTHQAVLRLGLDIHLFEALTADNGQPKTSKAITDRTSPKAEHTLVSRMLRHLAAMGTVFETDADTFAPTPLTHKLTDERFRDTICFIADDLQPAHQKAPAYFETTGYTAPKSSTDGLWQYAYDIKGVHYFEHFEQVPQMGKRFAGMMDLWSEGRPKWFQEGFYPVRERLIEGSKKGDGEAVFLTDVGGGSGHDIQQLKTTFGKDIPGKLVLQDRPEIVKLSKVDEAIVRMGHDFLKEQPVKGARAYYLHSIIQDWDDATNIQILKSIIPALENGYSKILINDYVVPDRGAHWAQTCLDWELMTTLGARHRTVAEHRAVIEGAGLRLVGIWSHPQSVDSVIELELP